MRKNTVVIIKSIFLVIILCFFLWLLFTGTLGRMAWYLAMLVGPFYVVTFGVIALLVTLVFTRKKLILIAVVLMAVIWSGGYDVTKAGLTEKDFDKAAEVAVAEIKRNFVGVESIEVTEKERSPMGSIFVSGYVNDDPELRFGVRVKSNFEVGGLSIPKNFLEPTPEFKSREVK